MPCPGLPGRALALDPAHLYVLSGRRRGLSLLPMTDITYRML